MMGAMTTVMRSGRGGPRGRESAAPEAGQPSSSCWVVREWRCSGHVHLAKGWLCPPMGTNRSGGTGVGEAVMRGRGEGAPERVWLVRFYWGSASAGGDVIWISATRARALIGIEGLMRVHVRERGLGWVSWRFDGDEETCQWRTSGISTRWSLIWFWFSPL